MPAGIWEAVAVHGMYPGPLNAHWTSSPGATSFFVSDGRCPDFKAFLSEDVRLKDENLSASAMNSSASLAYSSDIMSPEVDYLDLRTLSKVSITFLGSSTAPIMATAP